MKQALQLKVAQQLTLTPQLQQSIKLLQLSTLDLQAEVERFLLDNPLLERPDDHSGDMQTTGDSPADNAADTTQDNQTFDESSDSNEERDTLGAELTDWGGGKGGSRDGDDDNPDPLFNVACPVTLRQHLLAQLGELSLPERDRAIVTLLIEELDEDGYLNVGLDELAANLPAELEVSADELAVGLALLRQFDPAGVGAGNLPESLTLQLARLDPAMPGHALAQAIVRNHMVLLGNRDFGKLKKLLATDDDTLRAAQALIGRLNPHPAAGFGEGETHYVIPDVIVRKRKGRWFAELNQHAVPRLNINPMYARTVTESRQNAGELSGRLQEAKWLIKNIQQRFDTILKVSEAIVEQQHAFFEQGEVAMRPLILRDIADQLGLHESTVSRVTTQKYLLSPRGLFELKYFFGSALDTDGGGECSATAIKARIRQMIDSEDAERPLSDSTIADQLAKLGIQVARRTVAKYREAMQIPPVNQRKKL
jgi:RNA polymerase sigma-54 factor